MLTNSRTVFFSVGEPSGDLHGSNLIQVLKEKEPHARFVGFGGPRMQGAGMTLLADLTQLSVMWLMQAVLNLDKFWKLLGRAEAYFAQERPDAVILIDYPGFNWWIARKARKHGIPVFYYGAPQMWAWGGWRVRKMRRLVDHVLCKLPFEATWYQQHGCQASYVGHPYFDELTRGQADTEFLTRHAPAGTGRLVTILPGSRVQEVRANLPRFLRAAEQVAAAVPGAKFAIAGFNERQAEMARDMAAAFSLPIEVYAGRTSELIQLAHCCMACSGSVSLELMYYAKPSVIHYWVNRTMYFFAKRFLLQVKYMTLVNLLACEDRYDVRHAPYDPNHPGASLVPFPEYPACSDKSSQLAAHVIEWLTDAAAYRRRVEQLATLRSRFCMTGATAAAATYVLDHLPPPAAGSSSSGAARAA
ncbi:MAG: lipid-A-disaccharide synthase [Planctomycetota bacterium]